MSRSKQLTHDGGVVSPKQAASPPPLPPPGATSPPHLYLRKCLSAPSMRVIPMSACCGLYSLVTASTARLLFAGMQPWGWSAHIWAAAGQMACVRRAQASLLECAHARSHAIMHNTEQSFRTHQSTQSCMHVCMYIYAHMCMYAYACCACVARKHYNILPGLD